MISPVTFSWDGEVMRPVTSGAARRADRVFVVGETYPLVVHEDRSAASHNHYFAAIAEGWRNLPEALAAKIPSAEHLRKRALIDAGFCDEEIVDCGNQDIAKTVGATIRKHDDFAVIFIRDQFVIIRTAKSQSARSMNKADFQRSKEAVLEIVAGLIGVEPKALAQNAGQAA